MTDEEKMAFAEKFVGYVQAGDAEGMRSCYAPDAKIWHNSDGIEQTLDDNIKVLKWFVATLPDRNYRVIHREPLKNGFLQQHVLEATLPNGEKWKMDACCVITMKDGLITRLDEYLDSAAGAKLRAFGR